MLLSNYCRETLLPFLLSVTFSFYSCEPNSPAGGKTTKLKNDVIVAWNELTYQLAYEHDEFYSFIGIRTLSMVHLSMHDALNAIDQQYDPYAFSKRYENADPVAAVSQAAYEVLIKTYPQRLDTITSIYHRWMDAVEMGLARENGIELGKKAAQMLMKLREGDGHQKQGDYTPMTKPGDYQYTPGWDEWVLKPDFDYAKPFALDTVIQFRSPPPPALDSQEYLDSYSEVKEYGMKNSGVRSADQTHYAHWWAEFAEHSWNRIGRIVAKSHDLSAWEAARMFALINMDIYDIYLASLESKYYYDTWRPYTAIRNAETDGNPDTTPDENWEPEMLTPPWPEYPSAHAAVAAGGAEIVSHVLGTSDVSFTMESVSAPSGSPTRHYDKLWEAADDCADSRIMNGYHFRFATEEGKRQGKEIAEYIHSHFLRPKEQ